MIVSLLNIKVKNLCDIHNNLLKSSSLFNQKLDNTFTSFIKSNFFN